MPEVYRLCFPRHHELTVTLLEGGANPNVLLQGATTSQPARTSFRPRVFDRGPPPNTLIRRADRDNTQNRDNTKSGSQMCSQFGPTNGVARQEKCRKLRRSLRDTYVRMSVALTYIGFCRGVAGARGRQSTLRSTAEASRASCGRPSITLAPYPPNTSTRTWENFLWENASGQNNDRHARCAAKGASEGRRKRKVRPAGHR